MTITSAGVLLYRHRGAAAEVFLVHPGGPYWSSKDDGAWSVPKGLVAAHEGALAAAWREFKEETGSDITPTGNEHDLGTFRQSGGKQLRIWAVEGDFDPATLISNTFDIQWPPKSGRMARFPEVDRGGWFARAAALTKISAGQRPVLEHFYSRLEPSLRAHADTHTGGAPTS